MRAAMSSAVARFAPAKRQSIRIAQLFGLAIASVVPGAIWAAIIAGIAALAGTPLALRTIVITGGIIALFLSFVCAPVVLRDQS
jgi:hypothetical protein